MPWYDDLDNWIQIDRKRAWLEDVILRAGLAHILRWSTVHDMLEALTDG